MLPTPTQENDIAWMSFAKGADPVVTQIEVAGIVYGSFSQLLYLMWPHTQRTKLFERHSLNDHE